MIKTKIISFLMVFSFTQSASALEEKMSANDRFQSVFESILGEWEGTFTSANGDLQVWQYFSRANNKDLIIAETSWQNASKKRHWTHNVYTFDKKTNDVYVSWQGITKPIIHTYKLLDLDENDTPEKWEFSWIQTGLVGGKFVEQYETFSLNNGIYKTISRKRPAGTSEDFVKTYSAEFQRKK